MGIQLFLLHLSVQGVRASGSYPKRIVSPMKIIDSLFVLVALCIFLLQGCEGAYLQDQGQSSRHPVVMTEALPKGWTVVENVPQAIFEVDKLRFRPLIEQYRVPVSSKEMLRRALELHGNIGLADGYRLIAEQDRIPKEMQGKCILLPGTIMRDQNGELVIKAIIYDFDKHRWIFSTGGFSRGFSAPDHFACVE